MTAGHASLRNDATAIRTAAIDAVRPERLITERLAVARGRLLLDGQPLEPPASPISGRIVVVGGGKAAAGMAAGLADVILKHDENASRFRGLISVPEGCGRAVPGVEVRWTRPVAVNLPTPAVVAATREMLETLRSLHPPDLAIALISGGGSALLEAPRPGVPLEELIAVAGVLSAAGAEITDINTVRRAASEVKGGGLARACGAGRLVVLVLSDVVGDPLAFIASGPCLPTEGEAAAALAVLERFGAVAAGVAPRLVAVLEEDLRRSGAASRSEDVAPDGGWVTHRGCRVEHVLLGTNATAVEAAAAAAARLGYAVTVRQAVAGPLETADAVGFRLASEGLVLAAAAARDDRPRAIIEGGEAVVRLPADHGVGGRNQQTVVAAIAAVLRSGDWPPGLLVASIGTDGEDGPTNAAGGIANQAVAGRVRESRLDPALAVTRCDAFPLLERAGGLVVTGPTGTNVADLRIVLARP